MLTLLKLALCLHPDLARPKTLWSLLKDIKTQTRLPCHSLALIFRFFPICRRASHTGQCECVLRPELKYGIFAVQTQEKGRWKAELRYVFEFVPMFIVKLRFTSIVSTSWIEEWQVLISENHWNGQWILEPLIAARKWNFQETFYCDNLKWLIKQFFSRVVVRKRVRVTFISGDPHFPREIRASPRYAWVVDLWCRVYYSIKFQHVIC